MSRTTRAALIAGLTTGIAVFLIGWFLAFDLYVSLLAGLAVGIIGGLLIYAADARARQVETRVRPRFPGPPDPAETDHRTTDDDEDA